MMHASFALRTEDGTNLTPDLSAVENGLPATDLPQGQKVSGPIAVDVPLGKLLPRSSLRVGSAARNSVCSSFHEVSSVISWLTMTPIRTVSQRGQYQQSNSVRQRSGWLRVLQARQRGTVIASRAIAIVGAAMAVA
jgi:hypothetical protein